jgi:hypothetical protein
VFLPLILGREVSSLGPSQSMLRRSLMFGDLEKVRRSSNLVQVRVLTIRRRSVNLALGLAFPNSRA